MNAVGKYLSFLYNNSLLNYLMCVDIALVLLCQACARLSVKTGKLENIIIHIAGLCEFICLQILEDSDICVYVCIWCIVYY